MSMMGTGILMSILAFLGYGLRDAIKRVFDILISKIVYSAFITENDELFYAMDMWIAQNHPLSSRSIKVEMKDANGNRIASNNKFYKAIKVDDNLNNIYTQDVTMFHINYNGRYLIIEKTKDKIDHSNSSSNLYCYSYIIKGLKARSAIQNLLEEVTADYLKTINGDTIRIEVYKNGMWEHHAKRQVKKFSNVILCKDIKDKILFELRDFKSKKDWYKETMIPYKRNFMLYGEPGCGKSTIAMAIAAELNKSLNVLNLGNIKSDEGLLNAFSAIGDNNILLIEDIDAAFVNRNNETSFTFSCLINCLDGSLSKDGLITIITTNHIDKLDNALLRDGRMDVKIEIPKARTTEIEQFLHLFYGKRIYITTDLALPMCTVQELAISNKNDCNACLVSIEKLGDTHAAFAD